MIDFLVIGAGINGLLVARELAESGAKVTLLEKGRCCQEASWAGGGIVSPLYPWRYNQAVTQLASWAQEFYPELVADLLTRTGIDAELEQTGLLMLEAQDEPAALDWSGKNRRSMELVGSTSIYARVPSLRSGFERGLWMGQVANVRNPRLGQALVADLARRKNVTVLECTAVDRFEREGGKLAAVSVHGGHGHDVMSAGQYVLCAGAWSGRLAEQLNVRLAIEPVKGQMLLYGPSALRIETILLYEGRYIIPRRDGHLLVGSTLEYCDFDKTTTQAALDSLRESAARMLPELAGLSPIRQWAGLRPGAPAGVPYIGPVPGIENLYVNAGQFRNGLVLAPASARLTVDLMLNRAPLVDPHPYLLANRII